MEYQESPCQFDVFGLSRNEIDAFAETISELQSTFNATLDDAYFDYLKPFGLLSNYQQFNPRCSIDVSNGSGKAHILFTKIEYQSYGGRGRGMTDIREHQVWATARLRNDYGHILIRPETFADKLQELIKHVEIDFDNDPQFSNRFYVLADNREQALLTLTDPFRAAIMNIKASDFLIEIIGQNLLISNRKLVNPSDALAFATFLRVVIAL